MSTLLSVLLFLLIGIAVIAAVIGIGVMILFGLSLYHMAKVMQNRGL